MFPQTIHDVPEDSLVIAASHPDIKHDRISLSLQCIAQSKNIFIVATGEQKAEIAAKILSNEDAAYPISYILQHAEHCNLLLDDAAAGVF